MFRTTLRCALLCAALALPAQAAELRLDPNPSQSETLRLETAGHAMSNAVLGARTPRIRTHFTLSPSEWVESLSLRLHGDPAGERVATPVELRLNGGEPMRLDLRSEGFTADVQLSTDDLRSGRNTLEIALADSDACPAGAWDLDFSRSTLSATSRPRSRTVFLGEVDAMLAQATAAPRRIALEARGGDALALEALAAQGVALRTSTLPEFTTGRADLRVLVGTRAELAGRVTDKAIAGGKGPRVAVHQGRPLRLVITGDTEAEVRSAANAFATHRLPAANRRMTGPGEMSLVPELVSDTALVEGRKRLRTLGNLDRAALGDGALRFRSADPDGSRAVLDLDLEAGSAPVRVLVNGRELATLDASGKVEVPRGWLEGRNTLEFQTDAMGCDAPTARIGGRSSITVESVQRSGAGDLSRVTATGGRYADSAGDGTHVLLSSSRRARFAQYSLLAKLAESAGGGLTGATYGTEDREGSDLLALAPLPSGISSPKVVTNAGRNAVASFPSGDRWVASLGGVSPDAVLSAWSDLGGGVSRIDGGEAELVQIAWSEPEDLETSLPSNALPNIALPEIALPELPADLAPRVTESMSRVVKTVRTETLGSLATLQEGWSGVDWRVLDRVKPLRPRGRYPAPKAVPAEPAGERNAFRDTAPSSYAAAGFRQWERNLDRRAEAVRRKTGIRKPGKISWAWGERNLSLPAMLMMLSFLICTTLLVRSDTMSVRR